MDKNQKPQETVLITGAGKRIGSKIAQELSVKGYAIALHYLHAKGEAENTCRLIRKKGGACEIFAADLTNTQEIQSLITNVTKKLPGLRILINNAAIFEKGSILNSSTELFDRHFQINLRAPYLLTQQFAKTCKHGLIINLLDRDITKHKTSHLAYLLSKKSLADLTELSALDLAPSIRVNAVAPGAILPPAGKNLSYLKAIAKKIPLKTTATPKDIALAIEFLINNHHMTGQTIFVDGGEHLT